MERKTNKKSNLHAGHRSRMRKRFETDGFDSFSDHECLEMLLFNTMKRVNTNEIAHELIDKFGSISAVLNASDEELIKVDGIGDVTSKYLTSLNSRVSSIMVQQVSHTGKFDKINAAVIADWIMSTPDDEGKIPIVVCNSHDEIVDILYANTVDESTGACDIRKLADFLIDNNCTRYVLILHNKKQLDSKSAEALRIFTEALGANIIDAYYFEGQKPISLFEK
ncbi:MAG: hypothetical protein E7672_02135 [Ruminococcaceae bacterium]|nr:hypothetical protein [Oscillospiraceae bacterium]